MKRLLRSLDGADIFVIMIGLAVIGVLEVNKHFPLAQLAHSAFTAMSDQVAKPVPQLPATPLAAQSLAGCPIAAAPDYVPRHFDQRTQVLTENLAPIPKDAQTDFARFVAKANYFGAFAVAPNGWYSWTFGHARLSSAIDTVLKRCKADSGQVCSVAAQILPVTAEEIGACDETLSKWQFDLYQELATGAGPRAYARSIDGTSAQGRGPTPDKAAAAALADCEKTRAAYAGLPAYPCQVVQIWDR